MAPTVLLRLRRQMGAAVACNLARNNVPTVLYDVSGDKNVPQALRDTFDSNVTSKKFTWASSGAEAAAEAERNAALNGSAVAARSDRSVVFMYVIAVSFVGMVNACTPLDGRHSVTQATEGAGLLPMLHRAAQSSAAVVVLLRPSRGGLQSRTINALRQCPAVRRIVYVSHR